MSKPTEKKVKNSITIQPLTPAEEKRIEEAIKKAGMGKGVFVRRSLVKGANIILKGEIL